MHEEKIGVCPSCLGYGDMNICHCGEDRNGSSHTWDYTHSFVPSPCSCCYGGPSRRYRVFADAADGGLLAESAMLRARAASTPSPTEAFPRHDAIVAIATAAALRPDTLEECEE